MSETISAPTREQDHCTTHSDYRADCNPCFDKWLENAEVRTAGYEAICEDIDQVLMSLSPFALAWASAPESMRRHCEEDIARYFYTCGAQDVNKDALSDLKAMESMMKARGLK
jgi:hypothetical protein